MAGKDIRYEIDVDSSDAVRGLKDFSRAAQKAGKDAAKGLEDTATAGDKARTAIKSMAEAFDSELRDAAAAADALGQALGPELTAKMDVDQVVVDLNRMGVSFDELRADADKFATTLREVDGIRVQQVNDGLEGTRTKLDNVRGSADTSRNALANMIGNSAQDISGLSNSLGVAIGQLAEFGADARLTGEGLGSVAKNTLKVVPAVAGLAAAGTAVSTAMQGMADQTAFNTEQINKFTEALKEGKSIAEALGEEIRETGQVSFSDFGHGFLGMATEVENAIPAFDAIGLSFDEFLTLMSRSPDQVTDFTNMLRRLAQEAEKNGDMDLADNYREASDALDQLASNTEQATKAQAVFNEWAKGSDAATTSFAEMNAAMTEQARSASELAANWSILVHAQEGGDLASPQAVAAWNNLVEATGMENDEIAELLDQKVAENMEAQAAALEQAEQAARDYAAAIATATEAIGEIDVDDIENIGGALQSALDAGDVTVDFQSVKEDLRGAFTELETFIEENPVEIDWAKVLDTSQDTGLSSEVLGLIAGIRDQFQTGITSAFDIGGTSAAQHFVDSFLPQLQALGMSPAEAYELLGLPADGSVAVFLKPFVDAEAKADAIANLSSLAGVDPNNPIIAYVTAALQTGAMDPVIGEIISLLIAQTYGIPVEPQLAAFTPAQRAEAEAQLAAAGIEAPITPTVLEADAAQQTLDEVTAPRTAEITGQAEAQQAADDLLDVADEPRTALIVAHARYAGAVKDLKTVAETPRTAYIDAEARNTSTADSQLDAVAKPGGRDRQAPITTAVFGGISAENALNDIARDRQADIFVQVHGAGQATQQVQAIPGVNTAAATPMVGASAAVATVGAPSAVTMIAPQPSSQTFNVTVQAGVIGNRFEVQRAVRRALRESTRLSGSRN